MRRDVTKNLRMRHVVNVNEPLQAITWEQICQIDTALAELGPFGEIWLIKRDGEVKRIRKLDTANATPFVFD